MYNFLLPLFTLVGLVTAGCDTGICPGSFPNKTLEQTFGDQVKTCCSGHNSYIFTDFCDVSIFNSYFIHPLLILNSILGACMYEFQGVYNIWIYIILEIKPLGLEF